MRAKIKSLVAQMIEAKARGGMFCSVRDYRLMQTGMFRRELARALT